MPMPKYRTRRDKNETPIVAALRMIPGLSAVFLSAKDVPDLLIGYQGVNYLFEIKNKAGFNKVLEGQQEFISEWNGQVRVVHTLEEILEVLGIES